MSRPEHTAPPELFYDAAEAAKYHQSSRMRDVQIQMTQRALELMCLPERPCYLLDIGCGTGISGEELSNQGHYWVGLDVSPHMLGVALEQGTEGDLFWQDMGQGVGFRPGTFDGVVSISALQWLCNADKKEHNPVKRLERFFTTLYRVMTRGSRAVFQFYPETPQQMDLITGSALRAGFGGGTVVDYPNSTRAKKIFLVLVCGVETKLPPGLGDIEVADANQNNQAKFVKKNGKMKQLKSGRITAKDYINHKKERQRKQGKVTVRADSKFTGRKRKPKF